jgi:hypothetical protein
MVATHPVSQLVAATITNGIATSGTGLIFTARTRRGATWTESAQYHPSVPASRRTWGTRRRAVSRTTGRRAPSVAVDGAAVAHKRTRATVQRALKIQKLAPLEQDVHKMVEVSTTTLQGAAI